MTHIIAPLSLHDGAHAMSGSDERRTYRCYVIHNGRIAKAEEVVASGLEEAIHRGRALLAADPEATSDSGIEIWQRADLLYSDKCHAVDTGRPAGIVSPFAPFAANF